jgi:hypothetical protein
VPSLFRRFLIYQKERFPLPVHIPLITSFSFSAIGYSRACRGADGFIPLMDFALCVFTNITLFFLLRVSDEHKDRIEDAAFRSYLPVPRGLISLKELRILALACLVPVTFLNVVLFRPLLPLYLLMMIYLLLMRYEFFIPRFLKKHQVAYILSHMVIIPLADIYASSYDWKLAGENPPSGLLFFFGVTYLNGIVLEVGRKLRTGEGEEEGVLSYTGLWGRRKAPLYWVLIVSMNLVLALLAARHAHYGMVSLTVLIILFILTVLPGILFMLKPTKGGSKWIELMSLLWALGMYLTLGGIPLLLQLIQR